MDFRLNLDQDPSEPERHPAPSGVDHPPERTLRRHDAVMFEPGAGRHPTAYRRTALIVSEAVSHPAFSAVREAMNEVLAEYGMRLAEPRSAQSGEPRPDRHAVVRIVAISGDDSEVDALVALRALRTTADRYPEAIRPYLREVFMDRLLFAGRAPNGTLSGMGPATAGHGEPDEDDPVAPGSGYGGRAPVALPILPPLPGAGSTADRPV